MMIRALLVVVLGAGSVMFAQQPRDTGAGSRAGTGSIAGTIESDDPPTVPIARAIVTLAAGGAPGSVTIADSAGRFAFTALPAGAYTLTARKPPYLPMAYGQTTPGRGSGLPVSLGEGQQISGLTWKLARGGVVSGRILDDNGRPMAGANIVVAQYRITNGERTLTTLYCCKTDGAGMYRAYGLLPGEYLVSAIPPGDFIYIPTGPWQGRDEARQNTSAELRWAADRIADAVRTQGAAAPSTAAEPEPGPNLAYGRVYFPGTIDEAAATVVTLGRGEERTGVDFSMRLQPVARIEGRIVGPDGQPVTTGTSLSYGGATMTARDGLVSMRNLLPGRYAITVRAAGLVASRDVDVNGRDVTGLVLTLAPAAILSGKVVFESAGGTAPPAPASIRITARPLSGSSGFRQPVTPAADGTFTIIGLDPGRHRMVASITATPGAPAGPAWILKSAIVNARDAADVPFEVALGERVSDVVVTFTDRATELSGTLLDSAGRPAPGYYVVVFPKEESLWAQGSRLLPAPARAATNGTFKFAGLPPGTYCIAAHTNVDAADLADAAFLKQLSASATTITLADGEKKVQDLKFASVR